MIARARARYIRISPTKVRPVLDLIRGRDVRSSLMILTLTNKGATAPVMKILKSAISNAKQKGLSEDQLVISRITADQAPVWKRYRAAAFGRATPLLKRNSHITIELDLKT